jgi:hypothetical protein
MAPGSEHKNVGADAPIGPPAARSGNGPYKNADVINHRAIKQTCGTCQDGRVPPSSFTMEGAGPHVGGRHARAEAHSLWREDKWNTGTPRHAELFLLIKRLEGF